MRTGRSNNFVPERKLEMLAMQKQEIQREMARKERELLRRKQEQMGSTFCDLSNPGKREIICVATFVL